MLQRTLGEQRESLEIRLRQEAELDAGMWTEVLSYLRRVAATEKGVEGPEDLIRALLRETKALIAAGPRHIVLGNLGLRAAKTVREETQRLLEVEEKDSSESIHVFWTRDRKESKKNLDVKALRTAVIESLGEVITEMEGAQEALSKQAPDYIQNGDVVVTLGNSSTLEAFFRAAGKTRQYRLIIIAPFSPGGGGWDGRKLQQSLATSKDMKGVEVELVSDTETLRVLEKASKVIVGAESVLGDGGFVGWTGLESLALAAHHFSLPFLVPVGFLKLTPSFVWDEESLNPPLPPASLIPATKASLWSKVEVVAPALDFVPSDLVSLYLVHTAGYSPADIYRLINEQYHPQDVTTLAI